MVPLFFVLGIKKSDYYMSLRATHTNTCFATMRPVKGREGSDAL